MLSDLRGKTRQLFDKSGADCVVIINSSTPDPNFFYLTRMEKSQFGHSILVLSRNSIILIVHAMEIELAKEQGKKAGLKVVGFRTAEGMEKLIHETVKGKVVGLNLSAVSVNTMKTLRKVLKKRRFKDISKNLAVIRRTKTKEEILKIRKACRIASRVMGEIPKFMKPDMKERGVAAEIDKRMKIYGADEIAFPTIVAAGKNSSNPHYTAGDSTIKAGDAVLVDFGCKSGDYCSDMTRTFIIGKPSVRQKEMLDTCRRMQDEVLKMLKPGTRLKDLQDKANSICEKTYGKMLHMIGHGLGVEVHDSLGDAKTLEEGMVITIEPAVYVKGLGGARIEDDVLITKKGFERLTKYK